MSQTPVIHTSIFSGYLKERGPNVNNVMTCLLGEQQWQSPLNFDKILTKSHLTVCVLSEGSLIYTDIFCWQHTRTLTG